MISYQKKEELIHTLIHDTEKFIKDFESGKGIIEHDFYCVGLTDNNIESSCEYSNPEDFENNLMKNNYHRCEMCNTIVQLTNMYNLHPNDFVNINSKQYILKKQNIHDYKIKIKTIKDDLNSTLPKLTLSKKMRNIKCSPKMCSLIMSWILEILYEDFKISNIVDSVFACSNETFLLEEIYDIPSIDKLVEYDYCNEFIIEQILVQLLLYLDDLKEYFFTQHPDKIDLSFDIKNNYKNKNHSFDIIIYLSILEYSGITIDTGNRKIRIYHSSCVNRLEHDDFSKKNLFDHESKRFKCYYEPSNCTDGFYQGEVPYYGTTGTLYAYLILLMKNSKIRDIVLNTPKLKKFWQSLWFYEEYNNVMEDIKNNIKTSTMLSKYHIIEPIEYIKLFDTEHKR